MIPAALSCSNYRLGYSQSAPAAAIRSMLWRSFRHHLLIALSALDTKGLCPSNQLLVRVLLALPIGERCKVSPAQRSVLMGMLLRLCAAPWADGSRHGDEGHRCLGCGACSSVAVGHRRHNPCEPDAHAGRRSVRGGSLRPADSAVAG